MKKLVLLIAVLFLSFTSVAFAQDTLIDDNIYGFYKKYAKCNKAYSDYNEVLKEFPDTYYYATVKNIKARKPILFVTDSVYELDGKTVANYAIIYAYKKCDKKLHVINIQASSRKPLSATKRFFYWGGENVVGKYRIDSNGTFLLERNDAKVVNNDKTTYEHFAYKGVLRPETSQKNHFINLNKEFDKAKPIEFKQIGNN